MRFEYIYFARPDSIINNHVPMNIKKIGYRTCKRNDIKADFIVPVPDSGVPALGFAEQSKKFELGLIRNYYVGRTFIEPTQSIRSLGVKLKLKFY